ncbi:YicC/YloC family endoribonuclease [Clostridium facile]|uniref:YicC family protein n=1 Tax=Clostridium facile TaxID=2763035 RepID=A0ABR7IPP0_9CLOT|nr:YicC/YloC family endoribonuclease [Clostridium facile]MBC5787099.1 YicC family protein [Clostridium facile]
MIKSMTGFGRAHQIINGREVLVEIKSVNHRYFEFNARVPRTYGYLEEKLKSYIQGMVSRGKVEVSVSIYTLEGTDAEIEINSTVAKGYVQALRNVKEKLQLQDDLSLSTVARFPDVFNVHKVIEDEEVIWASVQPVVQEALDQFLEMRTVEGERLKTDLLAKLDEIEQMVAVVEEQSPKTVAAYQERLFAKLQEVLENQEIDQARILTEAAIFADKVAVDEETVRLHSHLEQFRQLLQSDQPVGRKCDFLVQEINRETNTIGSKATDLEISKIVIDQKSVIEKIREQIQNIE